MDIMTNTNQQLRSSQPLPEQLGFATAWFDLRGLRMHAAVAGPEDGPLLVMLHGFPEFWYSWRHQIAALAAAGYRVVAPDQRGYNLTGKTAPYDANTLARDVINLIQACGHERAYVVGHDWGAAIAWILAGLYPKRVRKLAIINVPHPYALVRSLTTLKNLRQIRRSWYIYFFQIPRLADWQLSRNDYAGLCSILLRTSRAGTFSEADIGAYKSAWRQPRTVTAMINWYRAYARTGLRHWRAGTLDRWRYRISVPTIILWGVGDGALGVELAEQSVPFLDDGRLVRFPDATHWVHEEFPDEINQYLLDHFEVS